MKSYDGAIERLLWPEKRKGDKKYSTLSGKDLPGVVDVTTATSYLRVPKGYLPKFLQFLVRPFSHITPWLVNKEGVEIGPIPKGTAINLLSNMDLEQKDAVKSLLKKIKKDLKALPKNATDEQAKEVFSDLVEPLLEVSKCPDFVVNRGHYFGTNYLKDEAGLSDSDKVALIEFLKTM